MTAPSKLGNAALAYAKHGRLVFPCEPCGKKPLTDHGLKDASTDVAKICEWWTHWPDANIGHPTGVSVVLDIDGDEGEAALEVLEKEHGELPETLTALTGKGRHQYFSPNGSPIRNSTGKLGPHLDIRGEGGYVILPPSVHTSGVEYKWVTRTKPAPIPVWLEKLLTEPERTPPTPNGTGGRMPKGQRHGHLLKLAGTMRNSGYDESTISAALLAENESKCNPPKAEIEVRKLAHDVCARYEAGGGKRSREDAVSVWEQAEYVPAEEEGVVAEYLEEPVLQAGHVTEIAGPRGLGKSNYARWLAVKLAKAGKRILYLDRDNPPYKARQAIRDWGGAGIVKLLTREKVPALLGSGPAWKDFPVSDYDAVILDSWDSTAEGAGEKDSRLPSIAISHILDIAHAENGPAFLILMNTVRDGTHSRGSGVVEDRADAVFEVRDITGIAFGGQKVWWEEIPLVGAKDWAVRSTRRQQREKYRMAFVASKFKLDGPEPEPLAIEVDFTGYPFSASNIIDDIDHEGAEAREQRAREHAERGSKARDALASEIRRRDLAGEPVMLKDRDAIPFLIGEPYKLKRSEAREVVSKPEGWWILAPFEGQKGHPIGLLPSGKNTNGGGNAILTEAPKIKDENKPDFRRPHGKGTAEIDLSRRRINGGSHDASISAENNTFSNGEPRITFAEEEVTV